MTYIKTIPIGGGHNKIFHLKIKRGIHLIDYFYFCTNEGISTHRSQEHIMDCLKGDGFGDYLKIKAKAIPIAQHLCRLENLPFNDLTYLIGKLQLWK